MSNTKTHLPHYSQLSKPQQDLLSKGFCFSQLSAFSLYSSLPNNLKFFKASFKQILTPDQKLSTESQASFNYETPNFSLKQGLATNKSSKTLFSMISKNYFIQKVTLDLSSNKFQGTSSKTLKIEHDSEVLNLDLSLSDKKTLALASVFAFSPSKSFGGGVDLAYSFDSKGFLSRSFSLWHLRPDQRAVLTFLNNEKKGFRGGTFQSSFWFKHGQNLVVSAFWKFNLENKKPESAVVTQLIAEDGRNVKIRLCDDGRAALCIESRVSSLVQVLTTGQFNVLDGKNMHLQFSFKVKFNN